MKDAVRIYERYIFPSGIVVGFRTKGYHEW